MEVIRAENYKGYMSCQYPRIVIKGEGMSIKSILPFPFSNNPECTIVLTREELNKYLFRLDKDTEKMFDFLRKKKDKDTEIRNFLQHTNNESILAYIFSVYTKLDEEIKVDSRKLCPKGCHECCKCYFYVTDIEYYAIKCYLMENNPALFDKAVKIAKTQMDDLRENFPDEYNKLHNENANNIWDDHENIETFRMCPFMDGKGCGAYPFRPIMCRLHSSTVSGVVCVRLLEKHTQEQLTHLLSKYVLKPEETYRNILYYPIKIKDIKSVNFKRTYPLFYFLAHDEEYKQDYELAKNESMKKYMEIISNGLYDEQW